MFSAVSASSNEVGVIENPTVSEFPKVSFLINLATFLASGPARMKLYSIRWHFETGVYVWWEWFLTTITDFDQAVYIAVKNRSHNTVKLCPGS